MNRRTFLGTAMTAAGAAALGVRPAWAGSIKRVGMQLYTVREAIAKDFDGTLGRVATIGYKEVEFAGYFGRSAYEVRDVLKRHGLSSPAAHIDYPTVSTPDRWAKVLDDAGVIGHRYLVNAWIDESLRKQPDIWKRAADAYNTAGAAARQRGIQFCYHNHNFEFYPSAGAAGKSPMDILLESCDPKLVQIELDLCWIAATGKDPLDYFKKYPGRFPLVHVKGLRKVPPASETPTPIPEVLKELTDVGTEDAVDWKRIFAQSKSAGIKHYFVEHDVPKDAFASLKASYDYVSKLAF